MAMAFAGCGSESPNGGAEGDTDAEPSQGAFDELSARSNIEVVIDKHKAIEREIQRRLAAEVGLPDAWEATDEESESGCGGRYSDRDAVTIHMPNWANFDHPIQEADWPRALEIFTEIMGKYGFDKPKAVLDRPNDHLVSAHHDNGAEFSFGTKKATSLSSVTGCHLTERAHPETANGS
ncbi:LppA family lipoprotein [Prauserella alba]|uniref:Lipoprotein n=1 Tax=Prauserella alba TaxID=176898 RepID=A0ABN1VB94_9PSEU|nr:LppA family lipoprotein [Prauserella alba]MCP2179297.1 Lipoprotein [Prauserella alba]